MNTSNDGGPAFPATHIVSMNGEIVNAGVAGGMSLRDYFAAKATDEDKKRPDPELLETARAVFPTVLLAIENAVARGHARYSENWKDDAAMEAVRLARALHAAAGGWKSQ